MSVIVKKFIAAALTSFVFLSCGNSQTEHDDVQDEVITPTLDSQKISAQNVFNTLPARDKITTLISQSKAEYNPQLLNDPNELNKYTTESSKALNLGVYGADLNVTGVFEQTQESFLFLKCVNILAKNLGVNNSFDEKMVDRMTANKSNRDSTLEIISQSFKSADTYLRENNRPGTSSLIVAGAWIEGIYLACNTAKETKNSEIVAEIFKQEETIKHLIQLLKQSALHEDSQYVLTDLIELKKVFEAKKDKIYTLNALSEMDKKTSELRNKIISGK